MLFKVAFTRKFGIISLYIYSFILACHIPYTASETVCNSLPQLNNGRLLLEGRDPPFMLDESIKFICDKGYESQNQNSTITCKEDNGIANWTQTDGLCKLVVSCNDPGYIENADRKGYLFTFPHNITYVCNEGYRLIGVATKHCSPKGQWVPNTPVACEAIVCPILSDISNGKVISSQRTLHSIATYECDRYYTLSGNKERVCQEDGTWTADAPTCKEIICYDPGAIQHVRVIPQKSVYKAGDLVIFKCKYDSHQITSKCLEMGEWSLRPPVCPGPPKTELQVLPTSTSSPENPDIPEKKGHSCDDPGAINNGHIEFNGLGNNRTVTYICEDGYRLVGKGTLLCMQNGKWDLEKLPMCVMRLPLTYILAIIFGILFLGILGIAGYFWYRWREKKLRGYGVKCKALTADATDMEEITGLDKSKKPIPVTVL